VYRKLIIIFLPETEQGVEGGSTRKFLCCEFFLGKVLQDGDFQDAITDAIIDVSKKKHYFFRELNIFYHNNLKKSPLRRLFAYFFLLTKDGRISKRALKFWGSTICHKKCDVNNRLVR
jgi:hypothetical protein